MAKKNNTPSQNVWILFATSTLLLSAGWLMKSFPVFVFAGLAPLFAISDQAKDKESPWNHLELILLSLTISFFCARIFDTAQIIPILAQSILFALAFAGYTFSYQSLGSRLGKFTILFFWLALEYLMLKLPWRQDSIFLADALLLKTSWWKWNTSLGYLGVSLWVLVVNLFVYLGFYKYSTINWYLIAFSILLIACPLIYSVYFLDTPGINREQMISVYGTGELTVSENYKNRAEFIVRTATWVAVLILLLAIVKNKTHKK